MSYLVFARKYRPKDFSEVIGQNSVVSSLSQAVKNRRIHHAYLFSGPRGIGKTSMARILAKSLNCLESPEPTVTPCNKCANCVEISEGRSMDVIEIDGASNRGIDEIRALRENVRFSTSNARYKVYIIDEVHQITHDAFNALLKTLEEPPSHVKFIFATTNPNKVPATILSRCQRFRFNLLTEDKIVSKLRFIAKNENIDVSNEILHYIAKASLGSIRDAESIFDQIVPLITEGTKLEDILDILGQTPEHKITAFISNLIDKNTNTSLKVINDICDEGQDLNTFMLTVIEYIRNVMFAKLGDRFFSQITELPQDLEQDILNLSKKASMPFLLNLVDDFVKVRQIARFLPSLRLPLEVSVIRLTYEETGSAGTKSQSGDNAGKRPAKELPIENKDKSGFQHKTASINLENVSRFVDSFRKSLHSGRKGREQSEPAKPDSTAEFSDSEFTIDEVRNIWPQVLEAAASKSMAIATYLKEGQLLEVRGRIVHIGLPKNHAFHKECLESLDNKQVIEQIFMNKLEKKLGVKYRLLDKVHREDNVDNSKDVIDKLRKEFDGEIVT